MVKFDCGHCGQCLKAEDEYVGMNLICPSCKKKIIVPTQKEVELPPLMAQSMKCSKCGNNIESGKKFCTQCGTPIGLAMDNPIVSDTSTPIVEQNEQWYYHDGVKQIGPIEKQQFIQLMRSGNIKRNTNVWEVGSPSWTQAGSTKLAMHLIAEPPPLIQVLPPPIPPFYNAEGGQAGMIIPRNPPRSPGWMAFWGVFWPGLGQLLCGQKNKGIVLMIVCVLVNLLTGGLTGIPFSIFGGIDAYKVAKALKGGKLVKEWEFFPSPYK